MTAEKFEGQLTPEENRELLKVEMLQDIKSIALKVVSDVKNLGEKYFPLSITGDKKQLLGFQSLLTACFITIFSSMEMSTTLFPRGFFLKVLEETLFDLLSEPTFSNIFLPSKEDSDKKTD